MGGFNSFFLSKLNPFSQSKNNTQYSTLNNHIDKLRKHAKKTIITTILSAAMIGAMTPQGAKAQNTPSHIHDVESISNQIERVQENEGNIFMQYDEAVNIFLQNVIDLKKDVLQKAKNGNIQEVETDLVTLLEYFRTTSYNLKQIQTEYSERNEEPAEALLQLIQDVETVLEDVKQMTYAVRSLPDGLGADNGRLTYTGSSQRLNVAQSKAENKMRVYLDILGLQQEGSIQREVNQNAAGHYTVTVSFSATER